VSPAALLVAVALLAATKNPFAAEFALVAARRARIEQLAAEGRRGAGYALRGIRELSLMLAGAQLGITMASLGLGAVAEPAVARGIETALGGLALPPGASHAIAVAIALAIVVFLHMVVGEMAPKSWAITDPERSALGVAAPFRAFTFVFRPFIRLLNAAANAVVRACGVEPREELAAAHSPADLVLLVEESARSGTIAEDQHDLLSRALDLPDLDAQQAMVPRPDVVAVAASAAVDELERVASESGRSRLPVHEDDDPDQIIGVLHVKDLLALDAHRRASTRAADLARPALHTPESRQLEALLVDMRDQRQHVAFVVDEFGTVTGLVSLEDLLEEIIGEFEDETDVAARGEVLPVGRALIVAGSLRPDEFAERTGVALPGGEWETVAGFVIAQLGRLPEVGDVVAVDGGHIEVTTMDGHRVVEVTVHHPGG
jgi:CBS domain containing-hemolysin-like protein